MENFPMTQNPEAKREQTDEFYFHKNTVEPQLTRTQPTGTLNWQKK